MSTSAGDPQLSGLSTMGPAVPDGLAAGVAPSGQGSAPRSVLAILAAVLLLALVLIAVIGPFFLIDPTVQHLGSALHPPALHGGHLLGTDQLGEDELSRVVSGLRNSLVTCLVSVLAGGIAGTLIGTASGYFGGWADEIVMRVADMQLAIPAVLLAITLVAVLHPSAPTVVAVLSFYVWVIFARVARAQVLAFRSTDVVVAIRSLGGSNWRILIRHVLPNTGRPMVTLATVQLANLVIIEASLDYLGIGIPAPTPTLGGMIANGQSMLTSGQWWLVVVPGGAIALVVICINILGDRLRDRLDPRAYRAGRA